MCSKALQWSFHILKKCFVKVVYLDLQVFASVYEASREPDKLSSTETAKWPQVVGPTELRAAMYFPPLPNHYQFHPCPRLHFFVAMFRSRQHQGTFIMKFMHVHERGNEYSICTVLFVILHYTRIST